ncbi:PorT [Sphingobacterium sp. UT-1RO-CII-1]|uniref:PorT n=1 Tax=Sphingobacterium sp. UT-1RO-CII-1 TaxID=2995225 RepID=UPI00227B7899|nr:PorT [Sphingobacterium sp. UT-1RO-CII-1]MCY4779586.1 PorT [Sphingobacterium sp. UT-1RO-CII-1]
MKKIYLSILLIIALSFNVKGQRGLSLPFSSFYDENAWLSLGLQYNYVNSTFKVGLKEGWGNMGTTNLPNTNQLYIREFNSITSASSHGMSVGLPIEIRFTDNLSSTFQPTFTFINSVAINYEGDLNAANITNNPEQIQLRTLTRRMRHVEGDENGTNFNSFEFPLNIRFRSDEKILKNKFNRYRGYITAGARYIRWAGIVGEYNGWLESGNPADFPQALVFKPGYFAWDAGIGVEIFFPYFRMSPEIKFSQSFGDVLDHKHQLAQNNDFMAPLEKTFIRNIQFSLIFQ